MTDRVALVYRGDRAARDANVIDNPRRSPIAAALQNVGFAVEPAVYDDEWADEVLDELLAVRAALVWVDPVSEGQDRTRLDAVLRQVAESGVWVSAHPDTIQKIGTKDGLYETRELGWGSDTYRYRSPDELAAGLPRQLAGGPRVLKQFRGNGGIGVWKVAIADAGNATPDMDTSVLVQSARARDEVEHEMPLAEFVARLGKYFAYNDGQGRFIDQPFAPRIVDGIVRCYLVGSEVVGFSRQYPETTAGPRVFGLPSAKTMYGPDEPSLQILRDRVEQDWVPGMQSILGLETDALPALWDADFLYGARDASGDDTYILSEINASCVAPFPAEAVPALADFVARVLSVRRRGPVGSGTSPTSRR